ncbi:MAG: patatin-like phospholipase family protein [Lewinella sp.]|nr:patatin-like phospholipase family protein [Lewinella sp.]
MSIFSYAVLSVDGGGIRGIIPGIVLAEIERRTGRPIAESFDLIAGTSTGGILAAGLTIPDEKGKPKFSAEKLIELYTGPNGQEIFHKTFPGALNYSRSIFGSLFSGKRIEGILEREFKAARLKDACTNLLITSYNTQEKKPFYFKSSLARETEAEDFPLREVARCTSAAPIYFPPKQVSYGGMIGDQVIPDLALIDGGVFANNPSVLAYVEAIRMWKETDEYKEQFKRPVQAMMEAAEQTTDGTRDMAAFVQPDNFAPPVFFVSIGTGHSGKKHSYKKVRSWGARRWLLPLIDILMQGVSESVDYQMQYLLPPFMDSQNNPHPRYYRFNIKVDPEFSDISDASKKNTEQLVRYGQELVAQMSEPPKISQEELDRRGGVAPKAPLDIIVERLQDVANQRLLRELREAHQSN